MSYICILLLIVCLNAGLSHGMECPVNDNILDKIVFRSQSSLDTHSCPGFFDSSDQSYCCYDFDRSKYYCCNVAEFGKTASWIIVTAAISVVVAVSLIVFCISCLCCRCCPWYRRRHRGTVYGRVEPPSVVHVIQTPANVAQPIPYYINASNPTNSTGMPQPPPYVSRENEVYAKQAPYNPNYVS